MIRVEHRREKRLCDGHLVRVIRADQRDEVVDTAAHGGKRGTSLEAAAGGLYPAHGGAVIRCQPRDRHLEEVELALEGHDSVLWARSEEHTSELRSRIRNS